MKIIKNNKSSCIKGREKYMKNRNNYFIGIIILFFLFITPASAVTYYTNNTTGNNANNGLAPGTAWATIQKAANTMVAGDTVQIMAGNYNEHIMINTSGSVGNYITYMAYPGDENKSIVNGSGFDYSFASGAEHGEMEINASFINVSGLRFVDSNMIGIRISNKGGSEDFTSNIAQNDTIIGNWLYNMSSSAIAVRGNLYNGYDYKNVTISYNDVSKAADGTFGEIISPRGIDGLDVEYNTVHNNHFNGQGGESIGVANDNNASILHNTVHDGQRVGIYIDAFMGNDTNINVSFNTVYNMTNGSIIVANEEGAIHGGSASFINVINNIVYNDTGFANIGISTCCTSPGIIHDIVIDSNTVDKSGGTGRMWFPANNNLSNVIVRNNVLAVFDDTFGATKDHNWVTSVNGSAFFQSTASHNYYPLSISPLIDAGTSLNAPSIDFVGTIRPQGVADDIGAYEYIFPRKVFIPFNLTNYSLSGLKLYGDGNYTGLNWNSSSLTNLLVGFDMQETSASGKIVHNVNNASGLQNTTYQAIYNGASIVGSSNGIFLDGISDNMTIADSDVFSPSVNPISILACYNPSSSGTIISKSLASNFEWDLQVNVGFGTILTTYQSGGATQSTISVFNSSADKLSNTTHCAFVTINNGTANTLDIWNATTKAVSSATTSSFTGSLSNGISPVVIGSRASKTNYIRGNISKLLIWNRVIPQADRFALFNTSLGTNGSTFLYNQSAAGTFVINQFNVNATNLNTNNNTIDESTRKNGTSTWNLTQTNITALVNYYILPAESQSNITDFNTTLNGNGSSTPYFYGMNWSEDINSTSIFITNVSSNYTVVGANPITINAECTSSGACIFGTNSPSGTLDTASGVFHWITVLGDIGHVSSFYINVTNGLGSVATQNVNVTIVNANNYTPYLGRVTNISANGYTFLADKTDILGTPVNMTIVPSSNSINVTVTKWDTSSDFQKIWRESSLTHNVNTTHTLGDFPPNTFIQITKNGASWNTYTSNTTGYITFVYTDGYTDINFEADVVTQNTVALSIISNKTPWNSNATALEPNGNASLNISTGNGSTLVFVTLDSRLNATNANLFAVISEDGNELFRYNVTSNVYEGTDSFTVNRIETSGIHHYKLQVYNTVGKQATIYRWTMSVQYLQTGGFALASAKLTFPISSTSIDKTLSALDYTILVDASGGNRIITLPAAATSAGQIFNIKKIDGSVNIVTIQPNDAETIDGVTPKTLTIQSESITIQSDGVSNWDVI